jgi:hypothetical protein
MIPKREILNPMDMQKWKKSSAYDELIGFITTLNESVKDTNLKSECKESDVIQSKRVLLKY